MKKTIAMLSMIIFASGFMSSCAHYKKGCCSGKDSCAMESCKGKDCGCKEKDAKSEKAPEASQK